MNRKRTFTAAELDVACEFDKRNIPVTEQNVNSVLEALTRPVQQPEPELRSYDSATVAYQQPLPSYHQSSVEVLPPEPVKRSTSTVTKIDHNHTENIRQVALFTTPIGLGTAILAGCFIDFFPALGVGVVTTGIVGYVASWQLASSANKYSDNAVSMNADREASRQERYRQQTEQLRITQHAKLSALQIAQQREAQQLEQERLQERQQARLQANQRQIEFHNRTVSETSYRATEQSLQVDYGGFDDEPLYQPTVSPDTAIVPQSDVLQPRINTNRELLLDWLSRVYASNAYNETGVIKSAKIDGVSTSPLAKRATSAYGISEDDRAEIRALVDQFRGPSGDWLFYVHDGKTVLNIQRYPDFKSIQESIYQYT